MRYWLEDKTERLINRFSPVQYATATAASLAVVATVAAFFYGWLSIPASAAVLAVAAHVGIVCIIGPLLRLNGRLGQAETATRVLAVLASVLTAAVWWLFLVAQASLFAVEVAVWLQFLSGTMVLLWGLSFVTWAARKYNPFFDLVPWDALRRR